MSKLHKVYGPSDTNRLKIIHRSRVRKALEKELHPSEIYTPEEIRHIQACVHYTQTFKSQEAALRVETGIHTSETLDSFKKLKKSI